MFSIVLVRDMPLLTQH